jgi:hypothetical protein
VSTAGDGSTHGHGAPPPSGDPALPVTWRPRRTRRVTLGAAAVVTACAVVVAAALPSGGGAPWGLADRVGVVLVGLLVAAVLVVLARPRVTADAGGLTVVNLVRARRLAYAEVVRVQLRDGDPWVMLDLADGGTLAAMGIQASEGVRAGEAADELRAVVERASRVGD